MAPRGALSVPTNGVLGHSLRLPSTNPDVVRALCRLKRESLISLVLEWLDKKHRTFCKPYLYADHNPDDAENENLEYEPPAQSLEELQETYEGFKKGKSSRREISDRILQGDWRHGISLFQLAMAEERWLFDNPNSLKWYAKQLAKVRPKIPGVEHDSSDDHLPRFHAHTFLKNMASSLSDLMKAHYYLSRHKAMGLTLLRVWIHDSPYNTEQSLHEVQSVAPAGSNPAKAVFVAFPDSSPYVYLSIAAGTGQSIGNEARSLRQLVLDSVPKALSSQKHRYEFQNSKLQTRSLSALLTLRGSSGSNAAPGGWNIFIENTFNQNALDFGIAPPSKAATNNNKLAKAHAVQDEADKENARGTKRGRKDTSLNGTQAPESPASKRRKQVAKGRFGNSGLEGDGMALERLEVRIDDPFPANVIPAAPDEDDNQPANLPARKPKAYGRPSRPSELDRAADETANAPGADSEDWRPDVRVSFYGNHVFAGLRQLAEQGVIDGEKMPGWMTGEAGVSIGVVKDGKIRTRRDGVWC